MADGEGSKMNAPQHPYIKPSTTEDSTLRLKNLYAIALLREGDPFKAACIVFPGDPQRAIWAKDTWATDPVVIEEKERLIAEHGEEFFLPNEIEFARNLWQRAQNAVHDEDYAKLMKLYADTRGFTKTQSNAPQVNILAPKVMLLSQEVESKTDDEWEIMLREQQRALTNDSPSS